MKPTRLICQNYRCLSDLDWSIEEGATALIGSNGVGKSSRLLAIEHALFGVRSRSFAPLLKRGETEMALELEFEHGPDVYRIRRGYSARSGGKTWVGLDTWDHFSLAWRPLTKETASETQAAICDLIGLSRETYRASAYSPQDDGAAWTSADPSARKAILAEILNLESWDALQAEAKARRQQTQMDLAVVKVEAQAYEAALEVVETASREVGEARAADLLLAGREEGLSARLPALQLAAREAHTAAAQAETRVQAAKDALERRDRALAARDAMVEGMQETQRRIQSVAGQQEIADYLPEREEMLAKARSANEAWQLATAQRAGQIRLAENAEAENTRALNAAETARQALARAQTRLDAAQTSDECPTCHQELRGEAQADTLARLTEEVTEAQDEMHERSEIVKATLAAFEHVLSLVPDEPEIQFTQNQVAFIEQQVSESRAAQQAVAAAGAWREQLQQMESELQTLGDTYRELVDVYAEAAIAAMGTDEVQDALWQAERALKEATEESDEIRRKRMGTVAEVARLTADLDQAQERARASKDAGARAVELEQSLTTLMLLERGYGKDGVPSLIVETVALPAIQTEANRVLDRLDSPFRVDLRSQKVTKAGDIRDALDIVINTPTGEAAYETLSGGEATRVNVALRIGLARLLATRRGAEIGLFAIDEPDGLDQEGADRLAEILKELARTTFGRVVLVSHQNGLRDALDQTIELTGEDAREAVAA